MSIERELLKRVISGDDDGDFFISHRLYKDIETFLAQPEQEQEPVAWMLIDKETGARIPKAYKPEHGVNKDRWELYPLHTTLPKREPLSDEDVFRLYEESEYLGFLAYRKGIKDAEKAHGIGGGE